MSIESTNQLIDRAAASVDAATQQAAGAAQRSVAALRGSSQQLRERAHQATDSTVSYIRDEPVKAMLIAAAAGAALTALVGLLTRSNGRG